MLLSNGARFLACRPERPTPEPAFMDLEGLRLELIAGDPGLVRLLLALRASITILLGLMLSKCIPGAGPYAVTGIYLAILLGLMVNDPCPTRRRGTLLLCGVASAATFGLGTWLGERPQWTANLCLVILVGLSLYLAKYGFRSGSLGLMSYFAFLVAEVLRPGREAIWPSALAILLGTGLAYLVKFWLLPDSPQRTLEWTGRAFQAQLQLVRREQQPRRLEQALGRLNETALALDEQLRILKCEELREQVLVAELEAGRDADRRVGGEPLEPLGAPSGPWQFPKVPPDTLLPVLTYRGAGPPERTGVLATQAVVAVALATWLGQWLAPEHWYWSAAASYMVFMQVRTLGDNLIRAFGRLWGTGLGIVGGVLVSHLLPHNGAVRLTIILLSLFGGYYMSRVSIFWTILYNTIALSLLWGLMGNNVPELLQVRLLTTLLGSLLGSLVALILLPTRTSHSARKQAGAVLDQIIRLQEQGGQLAEVRAIDLLVFDLRRLGSSGSLTPLRLPETARLVRATARLAYASRHYLMTREEYWKNRVDSAVREVRERLA